MEVLTAEPLPMANELPQTSAKSGKPWRFSSETAKAMQAKAVEAKARNKAKREELVAKANADVELVKPLMAKAIELATGLASKPNEEYRLERLQRTREQLEQLDKALESETDPKCVKSLCDAIARLCDVEQRLAMRPNPGSYRPSKPRTDTNTGEATPL